MSYEDTPLLPTQRTLRRVVGQNGDTSIETVHAKLDNIKAETNLIVNDTANLPALLGDSSNYDTSTLYGDLAVLNTLLDSANVDTQAILTILQDGNFGNAAIKAAIVAAQAQITALDTKIGTPADTDVSTDIAAIKADTDLIKGYTDNVETLIGAPANGNLADDNRELASKIDQIQNNTRTTIALLTEMEVPAAGTEYFLIQLNNFDNTGNMEDLNSLPTVAVQTFGGTDRSGNLVDDANQPSTTMLQDSEGRYHIRYAVQFNANVNEGLLFSFTLKEGAPEVTRVLDRVSRVVEEVSSTFTATDRVNLGEILTDTNDLQSAQVPAVQATVDDIQGTANDIDALTQVIDGKVDAVQADIDIIKNKDGSETYDQANDSLEAISDKVDDLTTDISGISAVAAVQKCFIATKESGDIAVGNSELVAILEANGVASEAFRINLLKVIPRDSNSTEFTVEVFEANSDASNYLLARYPKARASRGDLALRLDLNFHNRETTPAKAIYVKITNDAGTAQSKFDIEVRADLRESV